MRALERFRDIDLTRRLKTTLLYFGATIIAFILSIVTYPLFARYMGIEEFAALNYFTNYSGFFGFLFSLNLYLYFSAIYFRNTPIENEQALKSFMVVLLIWNIIVSVILYLFSVWILKGILKVNFDVGPLLMSSLAAVSLISLRSIFFIKLRLAKQAWLFFVFSVTARAGVLLSSLFFVIYYDPTAHGRLLGALLAEILCTGMIYVYVFRNGGFHWPRLNYREIGTFIWPLLLASVVYYPITAFDQVFLEKYVTTTELGLYSIGLGFATYLHTFNFSVYQTLEPDIIRAHSEGNPVVLRQILISLFIVAGTTTLAFCLSSRFIIDIMSHGKFTDAYPLANWLSLSYVFVLLFSVGSTLLTTSHRSRGVLFVNTVGLICIVGLSFLLKRYAATGMAYARVITYFILALISLAMVYRKLRPGALSNTHLSQRG